MKLLDDLMTSLPADAAVRSVLVGVHWTAVCSRHCGLASTVTSDRPHGEARVREVGHLHHKSARELAEYARSDNLLEASLGMAAINSLLEVDERQAVEINAADVLLARGRGRKIALVGHFGFIRQLREVAAQLWVIEQRPTADEHPAEAAPDLIPQADLVAITGSTLINHTLGSLLRLCRPEAWVMILGPSTPLSTVLLAHGATVISGAHVIDEAAALRTIAQGATFPQVEGVRLLTLQKQSDQEVQRGQFQTRA